MKVLYPNLCYNEVCYKETSLYMIILTLACRVVSPDFPSLLQYPLIALGPLCKTIQVESITM